MDYKKEYEAMVQRAREFHEAGNALTKKQMEIVCPELTESEDERILASIADCVGLMGEDGNVFSNHNVTKACVLAWLEKQKEHQNNSDAPEKALGRDLTFPQDKDKNLDDIAQEYVEGVKEYNPTPDWNLIHTAVCYGYHLADQKEQKPVEWSERHIADVFEKVGLSKIVREQCNDKLTNALQDAMLELSKVGNTEWSEEDEKKRKGLIEGLEKRMGFGWASDPFSREEYISWLKSLRPQPSWKPSEEQMKALEEVIEYCPEGDAYDILSELISDLKKL